MGSSKANRLEIYNPTAEGLVLRYTRSIYGKVTMLNSLRPVASSTDHLFIGTDRQLYFTVSWDASTKQLRTETTFVDQAETTARDSQSHDRCSFDPSQRFLCLELFDGILTVVPTVQEHDAKRKVLPPKETGALGTLAEPIPVRIPELAVRAWTWLSVREAKRGRGGKPKERRPRVGLLFEDSRGSVHFNIRELEYSPGLGGEAGLADFLALMESEDKEVPMPEVDMGASLLIPVPAPVFGVLVLAETSITYVDDESLETMREPMLEATIWSAWTPVDEHRWLIVDEYGRLYFIMLQVADNNEVEGIGIDFLGHTSKAEVITYLDMGYMFIGSHLGDSQVIKINVGSIDIVQTMSNIAPVLDFTIMDMGNRADESQVNEYSSGQARIVTGSGAFQDGSLRSVRSGVGIEELGSLGQMPYVTEMFSLRTESEEWTNTLAASFSNETRVFRFSPEGNVEELQSFAGFSMSETTILAENVANIGILQVTPSGVRLIDLESNMVTSSWESDDGEPVAAASASHLLALSIAGKEIVVLDIRSDLREVQRRKFDLDRQISCLTVPRSGPDVCIIGFWKTAEVAILGLTDLQQIESQAISEETAAVPRAVLLAPVLIDQPRTLFVALADGNLVTFDFDENKRSLSGRKSTILGTQHANLKELPRDNGVSNVFATCEHPSLIYGSEGRLVYSAVTVEKASYVCSFNAEAYPGAIAIATEEDLKLALVDEERTTHVQKLHVGETVRRIAYSTKLKAFAMGTIRRELKGGVEVVQSHVKLADEIVFQELDTYDLKPDELVEAVIRADIDEGLQGPAERFVVGTSFIADDSTDAIQGRILVLEVTEDRMLRLLSELPVKGACRALAVLQGKLVAALVKTVVVYTFDNRTLTKDATFRTSTMPIDISVTTPDTVAVADVMKSISIVRYKPGATPGARGSLTEIARHFQTAWTTAVAPVDEATWLLADADGNLTMLRRNEHGVTAEDRRRLETISEMRLGEMVNRIRPVTVPAGRASVVVPRAFLATVSAVQHGGVMLAC